MQQPVARVDVVRDTYFGTTIEDPYRWMEHWKSEEFQVWMKEQAAYTQAYLEALPGRDKLLAQLTEMTNAGPDLRDFQVIGERLFYLRRDPGENLMKLVVRMPGGQNGQEKTLFNPNVIEGEAQTAIDWYFPSWDGRYVAYGISQGGSENSVLHVLEVDSGIILDLAIPHTEFTHVSWLEDNHSFVYHRFPERPEGTPETERYRDGCTYLHHPGEDPSNDRPVFGPDVTEGVAFGRDDYPFLVISPLSDWLIGLVVHGDLEEQSIYAAPRSALADPATTHWQKICDVEDAVSGYDLMGDTIYLRTHKEAPRYKVIATSLHQPDIANAALIVPESKAVIGAIRVAGDYLLLTIWKVVSGACGASNAAAANQKHFPCPLRVQSANGPARPAVLRCWSRWPRG